MKTVLKVPLYLVIETEGSVDRNVLTHSVEELIWPVWTEFVKSNLYITRPVLSKLSKAVGKPTKVTFTPSLEIPTE